MPVNALTVAVKLQAATTAFEELVATHATGVVPSGNLVPDAGLQVIVIAEQF
jgi:hypothetical protein